jgi:release factor glutamine methyltransferase
VSGNGPKAGTVGVTLCKLATRLKKAGIESSRLDARLLVAHATGATAEQLVAFPERSLSDEESRRLAAAAARREAREPLAQIVGHREFWSLDFIVTRDTLTPRPDSETIVAAALALSGGRDRALRLLDFGTGTGCLLLALLHELPQARGVGVDCSAETLAVARRNAAALGLSGRAQFAQGEWGAGLSGVFDLIVANPPYIVESELTTLEPELRFEPHGALSGGADGLAAYRALAGDVPRLLAADGVAVLEVGQGQAESVEAILHASGLEIGPRQRDLAGVERGVTARKGPKRP